MNIKEYKVGKFWLVISAIKTVSILFLALFIPYLVFIDKSFYYKAGIAIGTIGSLVLLYYGVTELNKLTKGLKQKVVIDKDSISKGATKLLWHEIGTITLQSAMGFEPAIFIQSKDNTIEIEIPAFIGRNNLVEIGQELERQTRDYDVKIEDLDGNILDADPPNIGKPVTANFDSAIKNMIAVSYNTWLSGSLEKLDKNNSQLFTDKISFKGYYRAFTDNDKKLIEAFVKAHKFEDDEFIIATMVNAYVMTNRNIYFPTINRVISLKDIQSHTSKGWWTVTLTLTLVSGQEIVIENLDAVPSDGYLDFFK